MGYLYRMEKLKNIINNKKMMKICGTVLLAFSVIFLLYFIYFDYRLFSFTAEHGGAVGTFHCDQSVGMSQEFGAEGEAIFGTTFYIEDAGENFAANISFNITDLNDGNIVFQCQDYIDEASLLGGKQLHINISDEEGNPVRLSKGERYSLNLYIEMVDGWVDIQWTDVDEGYVSTFWGEPANKILCYQMQYTSFFESCRLYFIFAIPFAIIIMVMILCTIYFDISIQGFFVLFAVMFGLSFQLISPVGTVEDECSHLCSAFYYSEVIENRINNEWDNSKAYFRQSDIKYLDYLADYDRSQASSKNALGYWYGNVEWLSRDNTMVECPEYEEYFFVNSIASFVLFIPSAIAVFIGRMCNLGFIPIVLYARLFNFMAYVLFMYFSIKIIPFGKHACALIGLMPITIHFASSLSYDAMGYGICAFFIANVLRNVFEEQSDNKNKGSLYISSFLLAFTKGGVYLSLLPFVFIAIRRLNDKKGYITAAKVIGVSLVGYATSLLSSKILFGMNFIFSGDKYVNTSYVFGGNTCYTIMDVLANPFRFASMMMRTFLEQEGNNWLYVLFGEAFNWELLKIGNVYIVALIAVILYMMIIDKIDLNGKGIIISKYQRIWAIFSAACVVFATFFMMLIAATSSRLNMIHGIRPRYYWPLILLGLVIMPGSKEKDETFRIRNVLYIGIFVISVIILRMYIAVISV